MFRDLPRQSRKASASCRGLRTGVGTDKHECDARQLIRRREVEVKRSRARVSNPRHLERWRGSSTAALTYRWNQVQTFVNDIAAARHREPAVA